MALFGAAMPLHKLLLLLVALGFVVLSITMIASSQLSDYLDYVPFRLTTPKTTSAGLVYDMKTPAGIRASIIKQYEHNLILKSDPHPLRHLQFCSNPKHTRDSATILASESGPEGTVARAIFPSNGFSPPSNYNPTVLSYPPGSPNPYLVVTNILRTDNGHTKHHMSYCDMNWTKSRGVERQILSCSNEPATFAYADFTPPEGACTGENALLKDDVGAMDPRLFFSPRGEPLMIVGAAGHSNCWSQYLIDLRVYIPALGEKMNISHLPIRFDKPLELPRDDDASIHKNWFLFYDENNIPYVHRSFSNRSLAPVENLLSGVSSDDEYSNLLQNRETPSCIQELKKTYSSSLEKVHDSIHQATNSLRVTLCDFPCIPTIHNTVNIEIFHVKYLNNLEIFYRRYVVLMNITAPFEVIGRTNNIIYVGVDEKSLIYTVSMSWDPQSRSKHGKWNDHVYGGKEIWNLLDDQEADEYENSIKDVNSPDFESGIDGQTDSIAANDNDGLSVAPPGSSVLNDTSSAADAVSEDDLFANSKESVGQWKLRKRDGEETIAEQDEEAEEDAARRDAELVSAYAEMFGIPNSTFANPLVNQYYHGWLDDTIMLHFGISDRDCGVMHVSARSLLDCFTLCSDSNNEEAVDEGVEADFDRKSGLSNSTDL
ncbi:uncharacterized protein V2V93DRAFT_361783 [Kockiozyma suomiensis]|uniref:uncharacterized protein n=1 Tax=Kockiozyma suomiensis TaxID=1337062 RepID=UPI003343C120